MRDFLLSLLPILFVFVAIYKCKGVEEKEIKQSWGLEQGKMLQAIACIGVVIHHLAQQVTNYGTNINILSKVNDWDMKEYRSSWWWLRAEKRDIYAPIVTVDGEIQLQDKNVNRPNGAVRPVVWIKTNPIK